MHDELTKKSFFIKIMSFVNILLAIIIATLLLLLITLFVKNANVNKYVEAYSLQDIIGGSADICENVYSKDIDEAAYESLNSYTYRLYPNRPPNSITEKYKFLKKNGNEIAVMMLYKNNVVAIKVDNSLTFYRIYNENLTIIEDFSLRLKALLEHFQDLLPQKYP